MGIGGLWALLAGCVLGSGESPVARLVAQHEAERQAQGAELFAREWLPGDARAGRGDGLGPMFNARSCAACHFLGGRGGAGALEHNVLLLDGQLLHAESTDGGYAAWRAERLSRTTRFEAALPVEARPAGVVETFTISARNTPPMWGLGAIDRIPAAAIVANVREAASGITGRLSVDAEGRPGRFGWKGSIATLADFVRQACSAELGLEVRGSAQAALPYSTTAASARLDLGRRELGALTAFAASLAPPPPPRLTPEAAQGQAAFQASGCADCHTPNLGGVEGLYSDLLLHDMGRENSGGGSFYYGPPPPPPREPEPLTGTTPASDLEWRTPPLWGVADTAPYMHDGSAGNLLAAIRAHGGEARPARLRFEAASRAEKAALIAFLESLEGPGGR